MGMLNAKQLVTKITHLEVVADSNDKILSFERGPELTSKLYMILRDASQSRLNPGADALRFTLTPGDARVLGLLVGGSDASYYSTALDGVSADTFHVEKPPIEAPTEEHAARLADDEEA